ncbi:MAG: hypothetical protein KDI09_15815 [Halioglobus sp.]|nr:hypothetical protein [Halioglobus sp.]
MPRLTLLSRLALLAIALLLCACSEQDDIARIEETISEIQQAVEEKDFSAVAKHLHKNFTANDSMNADDVRQLLRVYGVRHSKLGVTVVGSTTALHENLPDRANSTVSVILTGSSHVLPADGSIRRVRVEWIKESGDWQILKAAWRHQGRY